MIIRDHNIPEDQARRLRRYRVHFRQIGFDVGRPEWDDQQEILRYLHATKQLTFITRDLGFYRYRLSMPQIVLPRRIDGSGTGDRRLRPEAAAP